MEYFSQLKKVAETSGFSRKWQIIVDFSGVSRKPLSFIYKTAFYWRDDCEAQELLTVVGNSFKLTAILHLSDLLDEWMHVIPSRIVEQQRYEKPMALPLQVAGIASCTKELACHMVMISHFPLC